jgi:rRNA maturation RNase YbeY
MTVRIHNRQRRVTVDTPFVKKQALRMMGYLGCRESELSVVFVQDARMRSLNRAYRSKDRPTNVLAFSQCQTYPGEPQTPLLLGDIVISLPTAAREADELGQPLEERVVFLLAHGLLHLLGYDHERSASQRRSMERRERDILSHLGG